MRGVSIAMIFALALCVSAQAGTDKKEAGVLREVQQLPVSELDPALPQLSLAEWLKIEAGSDATFDWQVTNCGNQSAAAVQSGTRPAKCVEADAHTNDGRTITLVIGVALQTKAKPELASLTLLTPRQTLRLRQLSDLPPALVRTHSPNNYPEIAR